MESFRYIDVQTSVKHHGDFWFHVKLYVTCKYDDCHSINGDSKQGHFTLERL